jgi:hypothetical protein
VRITGLLRDDSATQVTGLAFCRYTLSCYTVSRLALRIEPRIGYFVGGFRSEDRQSRVGQRPDLLEHGSLVPVDMLRIRVLSKNKMFPGRGFVKMSFFAIEIANRIG